jgi:hypothetical protein
MSRLPLIGIAAIACGQAVVYAENGFELSPDSKLHFTLDSQIRYDDNVTLSHNNAKSDSVFVAAPGAELTYTAGASKASMVVTEQFIRYSSMDSYDTELFAGEGNFSYEGGMTKLTADASYRQQDQSNATQFQREQTIRQTNVGGSVNAEWQGTAKIKIGTGASYNTTDYSATNYSDRNTYSLPLDVYYGMTPKWDLSAGYRFQNSRVSGNSGIDSHDHFFNVGARGEFTPKLAGQVRVGYSLREYKRGGSDALPGISGSLDYAYSPKTTYSLSVSNDFSSGAYGDSQENFSVRGSGRWEFAPQWSAQAGLSYQDTEITYATNSLRMGRTDQFIVADTGIQYRISESVSLSATYVYRTNDSSDDFATFSDNVLTFGASLRY